MQPHFDHCSSVWGTCGVTLQKLQNRAAHVLTFSNYDVNAGQLLEILGWKNLDRQIKSLQKRFNIRTSLQVTFSVFRKVFIIKGETLRLLRTNSANETFELRKLEFLTHLLERCLLEVHSRTRRKTF